MSKNQIITDCDLSVHPLRAITSALYDAARDLFRPAVLGVLLVPMFAALLPWLALAWWFWDGWHAAIEALLVAFGTDLWRFVHWDASRFAGAAATFLLLLLIAPAIIATALLISALFATPALVAGVARRDFPTLERRRGGTIGGSVLNAFAAIGGFFALWVISLPAWWFAGPFAIAVPWLLSAYLNQRLFRYDAVGEHASKDEMRRLFVERARGLYAIGLVTAALYFVPMLNLIAPVYAALAFIHFGLAELERMRARNCGSGTVNRKR